MKTYSFEHWIIVMSVCEKYKLANPRESVLMDCAHSYSYDNFSQGDSLPGPSFEEFVLKPLNVDLG